MTTPNTEPKPLPATDEEIATRRKPFHERLGPQWEDQLVARIEADRALILPSSCSSSHQEIRYTGEKCPLCEAISILHDMRDAPLSRPSEAPAPKEASDGR